MKCMKILIIEDDPKIMSFLKSSLEAEYFVVDTATDGETGSHVAQINEYDLIILDNMLPKKKGFNVLSEVREAGISTPVLVLSVESEVLKKIDLLNAGADDYLTKPFILHELLARVRALLRRPPQIQNEVLAIGNIILDTRACTVKRDEEDIYLTRKEFVLLQYLMQNEGTLLSRGMILEHVWDMNTDIFSNTIETHILSLRKKIGDTGKSKLIRTIPGRGYKM